MLLVVISTCCEAKAFNHTIHKQHVQEVKERHWNQTVAKLVESKTQLAEKVETILNTTAVKILEAKQKINTVKDAMKLKLADKMSQDSQKLTEFKNKLAEKMVETKVKVDEAKEKFQAKIVAGVAKAIAVGNDLAEAKKEKLANVVNEMHDIKEEIHARKENSKSKIVFIPLKSFATPARNVKSSVNLGTAPEKAGSHLAGSSLPSSSP